jgi:putative DNA primase/helicase
MIELAKSEPGIPVVAADLDADPWLLNVQNGTLDLRTGELREPDPALLMTKCCATRYDPDARTELWESFVRRTTGDDAELAAYIQRSLGYALFGAWGEKAFWFGYGPPDGAKSTLLGVIGDVLGDYHVAAAASTWMVQNNIGGNRGDVTRLLGARFVTSLEIRPGLRFDEELVKKVTGGDTIVAAGKYENEIQFPPTFALWMGANDRPTIRDDDEGMWSRMRCVPFTNPVPDDEKDPHLRQKLTSQEHAPAVLAWLVAGCRAWQREGIGKCAAVTTATSAYRADMNRAGAFFEECCELGEGYETPAKAMRHAYEEWCKSNAVRTPLTANALGQRLRALGAEGGDDTSRRTVTEAVKAMGKFPARAAVRDRFWFGVRLRSDSE